MRVLFFGKIGERAGGPREVEPPPDETVAMLTGRLAADDGALDALLTAPSTITVLDDEVVRGDHPLAGARELAFLPPVSGG